MKIVIATATAGAGHVQAAAALEEAWRAKRPGDVVERLDVLEFTPRLFSKIYSSGYVRLIEHAPELYAWGFRKSDDHEKLVRHQRARRLLPRLVAERFLRHLRRTRPDAVVCTHFLPLELAGNLGRRGGFRPLVASVVTDFEAHAFWMEPSVDCWFVAAEETGARLVARGAPEGDVLATGIPISAKFSEKLSPTALRKRDGLDPDLPTLLVLGGGFGMGPVSEILEALDRIERRLQIVVVAGRNERLRTKLASERHRHAVHVHGFVTNMNELMAAADLIVTKPGGLTTSEALALGRALLVVNPIPGQEAANADFLLAHGAAAKANRIEDLPFVVGRLFAEKRLPALARAARRLGRPQAAGSICDEIVRRLTRRPA